MNNDQATFRFIDHIETAKELLEEITVEVNDHLGSHPDDINWADVGDIEHVVDLLKGVAHWIGIETEGYKVK